jgi:hypothetical protein
MNDFHGQEESADGDAQPNGRWDRLSSTAKLGQQGQWQGQLTSVSRRSDVAATAVRKRLGVRL